MLSVVKGGHDQHGTWELSVEVPIGLGVLWVVAFVVVWLGSWSIWHRRYAMP